MRWLLGNTREVSASDIVRRGVIGIVMLLLAFLVLPQSGVPYSLVKISLLTAAELGLAGLMFGMFLHSKTYFAGMQLFVAPLLMLALLSRHHAYSAALVAIATMVCGAIELLTRKWRIALPGASHPHNPAHEGHSVDAPASESKSNHALRPSL